MKITDKLLKDKLKDFYFLWDKNDFRGLYNNKGKTDFYWMLHSNLSRNPVLNATVKEIEEELEEDNLTSLLIWTENPSSHYGLEYSVYINFDTQLGAFSKRKMMAGDSIEKDFLLTSLIKDPMRTYKKMIEYFESLSAQ
jgi:hypothetical protein